MKQKYKDSYICALALNFMWIRNPSLNFNCPYNRKSKNCPCNQNSNITLEVLSNTKTVDNNTITLK